MTLTGQILNGIWPFLFGESEMQLIKHWPAFDDLSLPLSVTTDLKAFLIEPFTTEEEAKSFWLECPSNLIILGENEVLSKLDKQVSQQILFCFENAEFEETLSNNYRLFLAIVSDDGVGCYLITPSNIDLSEVANG